MEKLKHALGQLQNVILTTTQIDLDETGLWAAYLKISDAVRALEKDQQPNWRTFYAAKMNTSPDHVRYWWELLKELQEAARVIFSNINMDEHVYDIWSGGRILKRYLKDTTDDTKEIPF